MFSANCRILFQGDSITDGNRGRSDDPNHILGHGYVFIIAAKFGALYPERNLLFMNRGCSGNSVKDLQARWQEDTIALKPDILSIAVGINDYYFKAPVDEFDRNYDRLLAETVAALPETRLVLCEPFGLSTGLFMDDWSKHRAELEARQAVVARMAGKYKAVLVRLQHVFDAACRKAPARYWLWDGVHPTYSGHQLMADEWIRTVAGPTRAGSSI
jgi:lysophospholipase L1-like esterase